MEKDYYEEIVKDFYESMRPKFIRILTAKYSSLRLDEAEDLYQDTFLAVKDNIEAGRVRGDTSWNAYIIQIGVNLASKYLRKAQLMDSMDEYEEGDNPNKFVAFTSLSSEDQDDTLQSIEVQAILGDELQHSPGRCYKILRLFYWVSMDLTKIAEEVGLKNADSVKVTKSRCMKDLISRVKENIRRSGVII